MRSRSSTSAWRRLARSDPGRLAFETLRAYALSLVRLGTRREADAFVSDLAERFPLPIPDVACCLAIVRLSTDQGFGAPIVPAVVVLGQERQLALNFLVSSCCRDGEPRSSIRAGLEARFRAHSRRAEARGDTALLDALLSAR
jgi:hypothetical protein